MPINSRGSALVEALPVFLVLMAFVSGLLLATFLLFSRAWIQYQSEQALLCEAESSLPTICRRKLEASLAEFIPWGTYFTSVHTAGDNWRIDIRWSFGDYSLHISRELSRRGILKNKDLQW